MRQKVFFLLACLFIISSCTPKTITSISKNYPPLDYREVVRVFGLQDPIPNNSEDLGIVKIRDSGFSTNCGWEVVIDKAKIEARKVGGNAIKITEHSPPNFGSSCHRITARILKVENFDIQKTAAVDSSLIGADYALFHVYRPSAVGGLVSYDLYLGDTVICRVSNKWKKTIKIRKDGLNTIWARTEVKNEIPINIKYGNEYYVRCGLTMGAFVGRPKLELVDNQTGKVEFQSFKSSKANERDIIVLNDGREIECVISSEDNENVYFTIFKDGREIKTRMNKTHIKSIQKSE